MTFISLTQETFCCHHFSKSNRAALQGYLPGQVYFPQQVSGDSLNWFWEKQLFLHWSPPTPKEGWEISVRGVRSKKEMTVHPKAKTWISSSVSMFTFFNPMLVNVWSLEYRISKCKDWRINILPFVNILWCGDSPRCRNVFSGPCSVCLLCTLKVSFALDQALEILP